MHDRTRIAVCRWGFLALCVVPTLLTCWFIAFHWLSIKSPAVKAEWERELSQRLGVTVTIESLSYPQPSVAELTSVKLTDAETGKLLAECRGVEIVPQAEQWEVTLLEPAIRRETLPELVQRLHDRLLASAGPMPRLHIAAAQLTIQDDAAALCLLNLSSDLQMTADGREWSARLALPQQPEFIDLRVTRNRQVSPPATEVAWSCPARVPAHWLSGFLGDTRSLGSDATFAGNGRLTVARSGVSGQCSGGLAGIDLTTAVSQRFPHLLSGSAMLTLERAIIDSGRLSQARGTLVVAGGGRIGRSLLEAAQNHLQLTANFPADDTDSIHYERLALGFDLTGDRLHLIGNADEHQPGILLTNDTGPLLSAASDHETPAVALARTLLPDSQVQVPAAMQTAALLKVLPLHSADSPLTAGRTTHTPTRLVPASPASHSTNPIRERSLR
ncbi:MAG TPA: hypothetical protein VMP01_07710 [Pirellulaceae bacterium]|nr:hypothetical protein [Pirellulaceae bacterium]